MQPDYSRNNANWYRVYLLFSEPLFWGPILIDYIKEAGHMTLPEVYFMEGICTLVLALLQVPMGALADIIGRRTTMIIGVCCRIAEMIILGLAVNAEMIWIGNFLWVFEASLVSGADHALLFDSMKTGGMDDASANSRLKEIIGKARAFQYLLTACTALLVGHLFTIYFRLPIILSIPAVIVSLIAVIKLKEPLATKRYDLKKQWKLIKKGFGYTLNHSRVVLVFLFSFLVSVTLKVWFFGYNDYFAMVGLDKDDYGVPFFFLNVVAAFSSYYAVSIERKLGEFKSSISIVALSSLPLLFMALVPSVFSVSMIVVSNLIRGFTSPFFTGMMNRCIKDSEERATVLSIKELAHQLAACIGLTSFSYGLRIFTLLEAFMILGIFMGVSGSLLIFRFRVMLRNGK